MDRKLGSEGKVGSEEPRVKYTRMEKDTHCTVSDTTSLEYGDERRRTFSGGFISVKSRDGVKKLV